MANNVEVFEYNQHFVAMMNIINSARLCNNKVGHKHHIIPRCWFKMMKLPIDNSKSNLVMLTPEDHLKVHKLAILCAKDDIMRSKMGFAVKRLMNGNFSGMKHTEETRALIKAKRALQIMTEESNRKRSEALKGKKKPPRSEEYRKKLSEACKGKHWKLVNGKRVYYG